MGRENVLLAGRAFLTPALVDACLIERETDGATDPETGVVAKAYLTVYEGPCEVQQGAGVDSPSEVGQASLRIGSFTLKLPVEGTEGLQPEDLVSVTACQHDTELVATRRWFLTGTQHASHKVSRKLGMSEVSS